MNITDTWVGKPVFLESVNIQIVKFARGAPITVCDAAASSCWLYTRALRAQGTPLKCAVTSDQRRERALLQQNGRMPQAMLCLESWSTAAELRK